MMTLTVLRLELLRMLKDPLGLVTTLAVPLVLIVALGLVAGFQPFGSRVVDGFNALSYMAPGMALFFLMFAVRQSAKTVAEDRQRGIGDRLRASAAGETSIRLGTYLAQVAILFAQLLALVGISTWMYGLDWGQPLAVLLLCLALAIGASGWIALLVAVGPSPQAINGLGTALGLIFAVVSRCFSATMPSAPWMDRVALFTPNRWGLHGFASLAMGGGLASIVGDLGALAAMFLALTLVSGLIQRRGAARRA